MLGRGRWTRRRSARHRLTLKPRHLAMVFCPLVLLVRLLLWYDFGLPWHDVTTFEGFATVHYLCAERPFLRPDTRTLGGRPPRGSDGSGSALAMPPWDGVNLFGGGYVRGEEAQPEYVAQLASASVDGATGYVFDEQRVFHVNYCDDAEFLAPLEEPEWPEVSSHRRLATIAGEHTGHYYHWFAEDLPRLLLLEEFFASADGKGGGRGAALQDDDVELLLPAHTARQPFIRHTLHHLGIPLDRVIAAQPGTRYTAEELYVPSMPCLGRPSREMAERVRARFAPPPAPEGSAPPRRRIVLIKRREGEARSVSNHAELEARLHFEFPEDDVTTYDGSGSLKETVALFSTARLIIAPHGAGLVNMLFAPVDSVVVEIMQRSHPNTNYWHLAAALGLEHWTIMGPEGSGGAGGAEGQLVAEVNPILQVVEDVLLRAGGKAGPRLATQAGGDDGRGDAADEAQAAVLAQMLAAAEDTEGVYVNVTGGLSKPSWLRLRKALSVHAAKMEGIGTDVMLSQPAALLQEEKGKDGKDEGKAAKGEKGAAAGEAGLPWCKPVTEEAATERAIAEEVKRYRKELAAQAAAAAEAWDPSYLLLLVVGGVAAWRRRNGKVRQVVGPGARADDLV